MIGPAQDVQPGPAVPKPEVKTLELDETYGKFTLEPLERGFATTLGNPLRRVLLSSIPGAAVTWVRIDGVLHEYSTLPHMKEEVMEVIQRVKTIRLRAHTERPGRLRLEARGPGEVYAGDIVAPADFEIVNPDLHLATLDSDEGTLNMEFNVEKGTGYEPAQQAVGYSIGTLPVDAIFSPVRKVNFAVEHTRVGQVTDYERLVLEVWTDRTISPLDAVHTAAKVLMDHSALLIGAGLESSGESGPGAGIPAEIYNITVEKLELSSRTLNCLKRAGINKVGEVLERTAEELLKIRNFGEKSLEELRARLEDNNLPQPDSAWSRSAEVEASAVAVVEDEAPPDEEDDDDDDEDDLDDNPKET
ncbi:MAG: DNA-directed RNA polymerase subunit alpha [Chloroflexota bacterium]|nr:DNA-directed RNA polymerase subunit alpha [Chloroflexota bacterium]MDE2968557.1 DNA-directed RNA polymerase subunit alpha [Chloroflexota bacterium]